jgi:hypothetical protein
VAPEGPSTDNEHLAALTSEPFRRVVVGGDPTRPALDGPAVRRCLRLPPLPSEVIDLTERSKPGPQSLSHTQTTWVGRPVWP